MAIATTYNVGTASINAGETAVTGQGTSWQSSGGIRPGDEFWAAGLSVRIAAVNSNTSLTLAHGWPGSNRAAAAYEIRYTPDSERVLAATREMLTALAGSALAPLVGLTPAANKLPYYNAANSAALADLTSQARGLLSGTALTRSGSDYTLSGKLLGTAVTQSALDTTAGRLLKSGDFGLGVAIALTAADNLDNVTISGSYFSSTAGNAPGNNYPLASAGSLDVIARSGNNISQQFAAFSSNLGAAGVRMFERTYGSSGWSPWVEIFNQGTILGPVSLSSGVPTGRVIERGSNANGEFVKFADGTMICTQVFPAVDAQAATGAIYQHSAVINWTFPAAFIATPVVVGSAGSTARWVAPAEGGLTTTSFRVLAAASGSSTNTPRAAAIGRWA